MINIYFCVHPKKHYLPHIFSHSVYTYCITYSHIASHIASHISHIASHIHTFASVMVSWLIIDYYLNDSLINMYFLCSPKKVISSMHSTIAMYIYTCGLQYMVCIYWMHIFTYCITYCITYITHIASHIHILLRILHLHISSCNSL